MKRSEVNAAVAWAKELLKKNNISLPVYAYWTMDEWKANKDKLDTVKKVMLGWDITDFGTDNFAEIGGVLYTVRNGSISEPGVGVPYCEKYIIMKEGQRLPKHYHVAKTEDIINRANGVLQVFLWQVDPETGKETDKDVEVFIDGISHTFKPGEAIEVMPGSSISLTPYMAHIFGPKPGADLVVGEVSAINDDNTDNYFLEPTFRFSEIEEDEPADMPMCNEYSILG